MDLTRLIPVTVINSKGRAIRERVKFILELSYRNNDPVNPIRPVKAMKVGFTYELANTMRINATTYNQRGGHDALVYEAQNTVNAVLQAEIGNRGIDNLSTHQGLRDIRILCITALSDLLQREFGCGLVEETFFLEPLNKIPEKSSWLPLGLAASFIGILATVAILSRCNSHDRVIPVVPEEKVIVRYAQPPSAVAEPEHWTKPQPVQQNKPIQQQVKKKPSALVPPPETVNGQDMYFEVMISRGGASGNIVNFFFNGPTQFVIRERGNTICVGNALLDNRGNRIITTTLRYDKVVPSDGDSCKTIFDSYGIPREIKCKHQGWIFDWTSHYNDTYILFSSNIFNEETGEASPVWLEWDKSFSMTILKDPLGQAKK